MVVIFPISECEVGEYVYIGTYKPGTGGMVEGGVGGLKREREETVGNQTQKRIWSRACSQFSVHICPTGKAILLVWVCVEIGS